MIKGRDEIHMKITPLKSSLFKLFAVRNDLLLVLDALKYFEANGYSILEKLLAWSWSLWFVNNTNFISEMEAILNCIKKTLTLLNLFTGALSCNFFKNQNDEKSTQWLK